MKSDKLIFDSAKHEYRVGSVVLPSVTEIIHETIGIQWNASQWHLDRGRAIHACAALIAQGKPFKCDPQIEGQVSACRKFFADYKPYVIHIEQPFYHTLYWFAGTPDLICDIMGKREVVIDYKPSTSDTVNIQMAAYGMIVDKSPLRWGLPVELHEDGDYKIAVDSFIDLEKHCPQFLSCLSVYNLKKERGRLSKKEIENE